MEVRVDRQVCCGAGNCVRTVPEVFDQDDEGIVVVLQPRPPVGLHERVRQAVDLCPSGAISNDLSR